MGTDAAANLRPRLMRDINCLHDPDRLTRKRALVSLRTALLSQGNGKQPLPKEEALRAFLVDTLLDPLVTLFTDPMEFCREQSILLLLDVITHTADNTSDTSTVCQAVAATARNRIGCTLFEVSVGGVEHRGVYWDRCYMYIPYSKLCDTYCCITGAFRGG